MTEQVQTSEKQVVSYDMMQASKKMQFNITLSNIVSQILSFRVVELKSGIWAVRVATETTVYLAKFMVGEWGKGQAQSFMERNEILQGAAAVRRGLAEIDWNKFLVEEEDGSLRLNGKLPVEQWEAVKKNFAYANRDMLNDTGRFFSAAGWYLVGSLDDLKAKFSK